MTQSKHDDRAHPETRRSGDEDRHHPADTARKPAHRDSTRIADGGVGGRSGTGQAHPHRGLDDQARTAPGQAVHGLDDRAGERPAPGHQSGRNHEARAEHIRETEIHEEETKARRKARADSAPGAPIDPDGQ